MAENAYYINTYIIYAMIIMLLFMLIDYIRWWFINFNKNVKKHQKRRRFKRIFATEYDRNFI